MPHSTVIIATLPNLHPLPLAKVETDLPLELYQVTDVPDRALRLPDSSVGRESAWDIVQSLLTAGSNVENISPVRARTVS